MSRHSSISSYYQPSSRSASPGPSPTQSAHGTHSYSHQGASSNASPYPQLYQYQQHQPLQQHSSHQQQQQQPPPPPRNQRADQILQNFYVKVIQIVVLARVTHPDPLANQPVRKGSLRGAPLVKKTSKWFNLELEDLEIYKDDAKFWRAAAITESPPMMVVELFLDTSEMSPNQVLVLIDESNQKNRIDIHGNNSGNSGGVGGLGGPHPYHQQQQHQKTRKNILLESWSLTLGNTLPEPVPEPPVVYKKSIIFFRSLYAYMRLLPAYQLYRRLKKQNHSLKVGFRVSRGHQTPEDSILKSDHDIGIEVPLIEGETRPMIAEYRFGQVETPVGSFSLKVTYRSNVEFHVDESEALLSSRFIDMDENYFKPTVATHSHSQESIRSLRQYASEAGTGTTRRPLTSYLTRRSSQDNTSGSSYSENLVPVPALRPRRNSAQSLKQQEQLQQQQQQRSGEFSSSQSSSSSIGTRMSRRGSSGAPIGGGGGAPGGSGFYMSFESPQYSQLHQNQHHTSSSVGTPPFSLAPTVAGSGSGHAAVAKHYVDPIMESPPFKLGTSQSEAGGGTGTSGGSRRPLSAVFSPFKSPSLSSSPSPSYLEAIPQPSSSSRPASVHLHRSPSSSSMSRYPLSQGSNIIPTSKQQSSGAIVGSAGSGTTGTSLTTTGTAGGGAFVPVAADPNLLSTSVKSTASTASISRVTSSFGHRHDSSGRRASSESLLSGRVSTTATTGATGTTPHRTSLVGTSSLFQFTHEDEDDVSAFVRMLDSPEPLKLFGKSSATSGSAAAGSSGGGSAGGEGSSSSMTGSTHRSKATLDRFQQLRHVHSNLSESMSASQTLARQQQQQQQEVSTPLSTASEGTSSLVSASVGSGLTKAPVDTSDLTPPFATNVIPTPSLNRFSQSLNTHQPGTPSPLHAEIPLRNRDIDEMIVPRERRTSTSSNLSATGGGGSSPLISASSRMRSSETGRQHSRTVSEQGGTFSAVSDEGMATAGGGGSLLSRPQPIVNKRHSLASIGGGSSNGGILGSSSTTAMSSSRSPSSAALIMDEIRRGTRSPFRHGSLDQERDTVVGSMERAMAKVQLRDRERSASSGLSKSPASPSTAAYGSNPEEAHGIHHHHHYNMHPQFSRSSATAHESRSESTTVAERTAAAVGGRRSSSPSDGSGRRTRKVSTTATRYGRREEVEDDGEEARHKGGDVEDDGEEEEYEDEESLRTANNTANDDDDMLFIMSELSPGASGAATAPTSTGGGGIAGAASAEILSSHGYDMGAGGYGSGASSMSSSRGGNGHQGLSGSSGLLASSSRRNSRYGGGGGLSEPQPSMAALLLGGTTSRQHATSSTSASASSSSASSPRLMPSGGMMLFGPSTATPLEHPITTLGSSRRSSTTTAASSRHPSPTLGGGPGSPASISRPGSVAGGTYLTRPASRSGAGETLGAFALSGGGVSSAVGAFGTPPLPTSSAATGSSSSGQQQQQQQQQESRHARSQSAHTGYGL